jgi:hypothetical protein
MATTVKTKAGATVKLTSASKATKGKTPAASPLPATQTAAIAPVAPTLPIKQAKAPQFAALVMGAKPYRVKAAHNMAAMQAIQALLASGPAPVPAVLAALAAHPAVGGASGFVGYCVRRGYLQAA